VKSIARLVCFFVVSFAIVFLFAGIFQLQIVLLKSVQALSVLPTLSFSEGVSAFQSVLPVALYLSLLLGLAYAGGQPHIRTAPVVICLFILASIYTIGISIGLDYIKNLPKTFTITGKSIPVESGTIVSTSEGPIVVFNNSENPEEETISYVQVFPQQEIEYHEGNLPTLSPFVDRFFSLLNGGFLSIAEQFEKRLHESLLSFTVYLSALLFLLLSLYGLFRISEWPAVNVCLGSGAFLGFLIFKPVLRRLDVFLVQVPSMFIEPILFTVLAFAIILCTVVVRLVKRWKNL
jgi:hypothetical protein